MMMNKRLAAFVLVLMLALQTAFPVFAQDADVIRVRTAEDLLKLAEDCRLDSYSQGKTVVLEADISFDGADFVPIPTFGGTFEGNGHTVSGIELLDGTDPVGFFCVLQRSAVVKDLTVEAIVSPVHGADVAGGIAGENHGVIMNCRFKGTVTGESNVGGIVGFNGTDGAVAGCVSAGVIIGENMTGGIAGRNCGVITDCENTAQVNTVSIDPSVSLEDLNGDFLLDITKWTSPDAASSSMDIGGIAGSSSGSILSCVNRGEIGYPHVGYNVGGVAGRNCGYVSMCENHALVHGRKDVGGIVGQMEPDIALDLSEDKLLRLQTELDELKVLLTDMKNSGISAAGEVNSRVDAILSHLDGASQSAEALGSAAGTYADSVADEFNRGSLIFADVLERAEDVAAQLTELSDTASEGLSQLEKATEDLASAAELTE